MDLENPALKIMQPINSIMIIRTPLSNQNNCLINNLIICLILCGIIILSPNFLEGQPTIQWSHLYGGSNSDLSLSFQKTTDGGYILAGVTKSEDGDLNGHYGAETWDGWIIKTDEEGVLQWQQHYGGTGYDKIVDVQPTQDGGYIASGYSTSSDGDLTENKGNDDAWIIKLNGIGEIEWQKTYGGSSYDETRRIRPLKNGGYLVAGTSRSQDGDLDTLKKTGGGNYWLFQITETGEIVWMKTYGGNETDVIFDMELTNDGGCVMVGNALSSDEDITENKGLLDCWIVKVDTIGNIQWQHAYGGSNNDNAISVSPTFDGGYIIAGGTHSSDGDVSFIRGEEDFWVLKLHSDGTIQWQKTYGGSLSDHGIAVIQTIDKGFLVGGESTSADGNLNGNHGDGDLWLLKLDTIGQIQWQKNFGGSESELPFKLLQLENMDYVIAGVSASSDGDLSDNHGRGDFWIFKLSSVTSTTYIAPLLKEMKIYPNPLTSNLLNLTFNSERTLDVYIEITTNLGKKIFSEKRQTISGKNNIPLSLPVISASIYFITIKVEGQLFTKKIEKFK